ncbi:unnamed protein product [Kluyveromyces dobzhanskii CBS 2104]|uniref:WGS project CCBQ000000000 data, contig 00011 n=1 Tax=Kluyveromyces dobzhanskii CBS 2104 TaxID=1427455 RepID=A0A0A8L7A2_9SACH|nr:unnamed protein product [Kluyveromyces dobzhanskii CBS 2104]
MSVSKEIGIEYASEKVEVIEKDFALSSKDEYVALTRLAKFIKLANQKLEKFEAVLPSNTVASTTSFPRQGLNKLRQRGRKFLRWNAKPVESTKKLSYQDYINDPNAPAFYKFLRRTTQELTSVLPETHADTLIAEEFEKSMNRSSITSPLVKFSQIYDDHFTTFSSSSTTLHSPTKGSTRSSSQNSSKTPRFDDFMSHSAVESSYSASSDDQCHNKDVSQYNSLNVSSFSINKSKLAHSDLISTTEEEKNVDLDTQQVIQTLDFLDEHLDLFIEDPLSIKKTIQLYNWDNACYLGRQRHLHFYELPFPWRENRYIIHGYRFYDSHLKSLLSIINWYGWHNETLNIWSHLFGAVYLAYLLLMELPTTKVFLSAEVPLFGKIIIQVFLAAGIKCLLSSSVWHTLNGTCRLPLRNKFACIDYTGITVLITASILSTEFVSVYNTSTQSLSLSMTIYMTCSLLLGVFGSFMNWSPRFDRPESRPFRIAFYVLLAGLGMLSFLHLTVRRGIEHSSQFFKPVWNRSIVWYLIGVVFYGSFIPERWRTDVELDCQIPTDAELCSNLDILTKHKHIHFRAVPSKSSRTGFLSLWWVDYFMASHTFWHFFVLLGVVGHYNALLDMFETKWHL